MTHRQCFDAGGIDIVATRIITFFMTGDLQIAVGIESAPKSPVIKNPCALNEFAVLSSSWKYPSIRPALRPPSANLAGCRFDVRIVLRPDTDFVAVAAVPDVPVIRAGGSSGSNGGSRLRSSHSRFAGDPVRQQFSADRVRDSGTQPEPL